MLNIWNVCVCFYFFLLWIITLCVWEPCLDRVVFFNFVLFSLFFTNNLILLYFFISSIKDRVNLLYLIISKISFSYKIRSFIQCLVRILISMAHAQNSRYCDGAITRRRDKELTMTRESIVSLLLHHRVIAIVSSRNRFIVPLYHCNRIVMLLHHRYCAIASLSSHHRFIVIALSYHCSIDANIDGPMMR